MPQPQIEWSERAHSNIRTLTRSFTCSNEYSVLRTINGSFDFSVQKKNSRKIRRRKNELMRILFIGWCILACNFYSFQIWCLSAGFHTVYKILLLLMPNSNIFTAWQKKCDTKVMMGFCTNDTIFIHIISFSIPNYNPPFYD